MSPQRMLAARDERDAMRTTLLFNVAHYALRPWAVDHCGAGVAHRLSHPQSIGDAFPLIDKAIGCATIWPIPRCSSTCHTACSG